MPDLLCVGRADLLEYPQHLFQHVAPSARGARAFTYAAPKLPSLTPSPYLSPRSRAMPTAFPRYSIARQLDLRRELPCVAREGEDYPLLVPQQVCAAFTFQSSGRGSERDGTPQSYL